MTGQPVRDLQEMLLFLSWVQPNIPQIIPDGAFGERTLEAVMVFQRDHRLPVTGVVDYDTWAAIYADWKKTWRQMGTPSALRTLCSGKACVREGERIPPVPIVQAMFDGLSAILTNFKSTEVDGLFHSHTLENIKEVQRTSGLEPTGELDRAAWGALARLYELFITREKMG